MQRLLEALLDAVSSGTSLGKPFASSVPSDQELPPLAALPQGESGGPRAPKDAAMGPMGWARDLVRAHSSEPAPSLFLAMQPKPRTGTACYMGVFSS